MISLSAGRPGAALGYSSVRSGTQSVDQTRQGVAGHMSESATRQNLPAKNAPWSVSTSSARVLSADVMATLQKIQEAGAGSASPAPAEDPVKRETANGFNIIVAGHSIDAREGISLLRPYDGKLTYSPELQAQIDADEPPQLNSTSEALKALPPGATSSYMPITPQMLAGQWNRGNPLSQPIDMFEKNSIADLIGFMERLEAERQLKERYGDDVKLAYSHADEGYIMLTPDDLHYDEINSVQQTFDKMLSEIKLGYNFSEGELSVLREYNYRV